MDSRQIDKIRTLLNADVARKMLIKYFIAKGYQDSFDRLIYPPSLQDLPLCIPQLESKVEVVPHACDINPMLGTAMIGWNLFVLGNHRMFLGESVHNDLPELARQLTTGSVVPSTSSQARRQTTPRRIVNFVARVLERHAGGYVNLNQLPMNALPHGGPGQNSPFRPQVGGSQHNFQMFAKG